MKILTMMFLTLIALGFAGLLFVYSGAYDMGADAPHWPLTHWLISTLRDRSVASASAQVQVPNLNDSSLVLKGAGQYAAMCTGCHLTPGKPASELRAGLYPQPPNLT